MYTYDLNAIAFSFLGYPFDGGFGDGSAIKIEPNAPKYILKTGVDGTVTRCSSGDRTYKVTITLGQQSEQNTILAAVLQAALAAPNGAGVGPLFCRDQNGDYVIQSPSAWLEGDPATVEFAAESKDREWVIYACDSVVFSGGSFPVGSVPAP